MSKNDFKRILREHKVYCVESKKKSVNAETSPEGEKKQKQKKVHPSKMKYKKDA